MSNCGCQICDQNMVVCFLILFFIGMKCQLLLSLIRDDHEPWKKYHEPNQNHICQMQCPTILNFENLPFIHAFLIEPQTRICGEPIKGKTLMID